MPSTSQESYKPVGRPLFAQPSTSTPAKQVELRTPSISEISGASSDSLSIDVSELMEPEKSDEDPDYEPSFEMTAVLPDEVNDMYEEVVYEEMEFALEKEGDEEVESVEDEIGPGIKQVKTEEDVGFLSEAMLCFAHVEQIKSLAKTNIKKCMHKDCKRPNEIKVTDEFHGSALYLKWVCESGHLVHRWCAQQKLNRNVNSVDFIASLATLTSGNNIGKLILWAQHLNLKFVSATAFHKIQRCYLVPTIDRYWEEKQLEVIQSFGNEELIVLGDGRNDSPGHSAQYCSYTLMEESTKKILTIQTLDKRVTERKSINMEKVGFQNAMNDLRGKGVTVKEVVTDAHLGIGAIMKRNYMNMKHSHDIWHAANNLGKKVMKLAQKKENKILIPWQRDIINHFWFTCGQANTYQEFLCIWRSLLHHITNQHKWSLSHGSGINHCLHDPIDEEEERAKQWLCPKKDQRTLHGLASVVLDKRLLNNVHYYLNFRSTAELEVFHQLILMYCAKRFAYTPPVYRARNKLAAIDHNHHADRALKRNRDGDVLYHRYYSKKSGRWSVFPIKEKKDYFYVKELVQRSVTMRLNDRVGMQKRVLEDDDPRRLAFHLAPVEPPSTEELVKEKVSRFKK